ncbi:protein of unknown function [Haladaptatus litoreus]|uniref:DUF1917 domain-containing protein n=1 Tax=Haladaptatus litoreus TaxID=553468 RepID=A0A1N6XC90_9EURY|nr:putative phosphothreonine lyase domain-containg protein [Haladaptatus litoreus]SIQ99869.1 protein of unknown function [Haladaptatus litoreus]
MSTQKSPTEITEEGTYWLRSRDVSDSPRIGGDGYFTEHDVTRPEDVTADDLPPVDEDAVREIDREALEQEKTIGKWQLTGSAETIEELWPEILDDASEGVIWAVKAMTTFGYEELPYDDYMIVVYTPNYFAKHDVDRVREHLRNEYDVEHELFYKPDIYTAKGVVAETAEEWGLSMPARYRS